MGMTCFLHQTRSPILDMKVVLFSELSVAKHLLIIQECSSWINTQFCPLIEEAASVSSTIRKFA